MRGAIFVLCILLGGCTSATVVMPEINAVREQVVTTTTISTTTTTLAPTTTTVVRPTSTTVPATTTSALVDKAAPTELRIPSVGIVAPMVTVGPRYGVDRWDPQWGTLELYGTDHMVDPGELGGSFILGHSNSHKDFGPDVFFNLVDDERYDTDFGVNADDMVEIDLEDGSTCRFQIIDIRKENAPGEPLALSPGRYIPKFEHWGLGGPQDERAALTKLALEANVARLYLMGSYAGPNGNEMVTYNGGEHQAYSAYIAADLESCTPSEEGSG